jgi:tRNA threonylcarbamoyladenosine biosynthesis protein TsaE
MHQSPINAASLDITELSVTEIVGVRLGEIAVPGDVILLYGDLGAGKTTIAQFIGRGLSVPFSFYITSPTFSLMHEYPGRIPLYHLDLYRLSGEEEVEDLGLIDYLYGDGLCLVEWPDRLGSLIPEERLDIVLTYDTAMHRQLDLACHGASWWSRLPLLFDNFPCR